MGTTHRVYKLKRKGIPLEETLQIMKDINSTLCIGDKKRFQYQLELNNPNQLKEVSNSFKILSQNLLIKFKLKDSNELNKVFSSPKLYDKAWFFNHQNTNPEKAYTSYWIDLNSKNQIFSLSIGLPYTAGIEYSKIELSKVLKFLVNKNLIFIVSGEIDDLSKMLLDLNSTNFNGSWSYQDRFKISARGNVTPKGSNQKRPADVRITFTDKDYKKYRGFENMAVVFHKALNEYFSDPEYYVQGSIVSKFDSEILRYIDDINFDELKIPISTDVNSKTDFSISDIDFSTNGEKNITIEEFDWLESTPNHGDNGLNLWINSIDDYEFEIEVSKQIDEEYYTRIESLIGEELEFWGTV
jgi:hypothetical protein